MPRVARELQPIQVKRLDKPGFHPVGGVAGLLLQVRSTGSRYWVLRTHVGGKRRNIGIGGYPEIGLSEARDEARELKRKIRSGIDPVNERRQRKAKLIAEAEQTITFRDAWREFWRDKRSELGDKTARHWEASIENYALPVLGSLIVREIETRHIDVTLRPIWESKTVTAKKLRGRLENILSWATVKGYRRGDNPARWADNLKELLPRPSKIHRTQHFRALAIDDAPEFLAEIRRRDGSAARCLEFVTLTAARSGEARGARWPEIDLQRRTWTISAKRMKMDREHVVPLSDAALKLLRTLPHDSELVFPAPRGGVLSDMALLNVLKRSGWHDRTTVHGLRATFKSYAVERTDSPDFVSELALAHDVGDSVMKAYQRSDLLEKRRELAEVWAGFLENPSHVQTNAQGGEVS